MLADRIDELDRLGNPTIAFQASGIDGIKVRIVAKCDDEATAERILDAEETLIRGLLGDVVFGIDEQSMEAVVLDLLRRKGLTLAAAETLSGGILSARMSALDIAMETFRGASDRSRDARHAGGDSPSSAPQRLRRTCARSSPRTWASRRSLRTPARAMRQARSSSAPTSRATQHAEKVILPPDRRRMREFAVISLLNLLRRTLSA